MEMPLRVVTSSDVLKVQKIEYYDGLEVDTMNEEGTFKYAFNNSDRVCMWSPPSNGPTVMGKLQAKAPAKWSAAQFFPDLTKYTFQGKALVGGILCDKYTLDATHGTIHTMDDHISFYYDPILGKPVRWHMHARHVTFGSHTDEYIFEYMSLVVGTPPNETFKLQPGCSRPTRAEISVPFASFLASASTLDRHVYRHGIVEANLELVNNLNRQHAGRTRFAANQFLSMTKEEVMRFRGGVKALSRSERRKPEHLSFVREHNESHGQDSPKSFDWRVARPGVIAPVKDQGICGSCWTYGGMGPIESHAVLQNGGNLVTLPEQMMLDCAWTGGGNSGCDGGNSDVGALEIIRKYGGIIPTASDYGTYQSVNGFCKDMRFMTVGAKITGWVDVKPYDEAAILQALVAKGPVSVMIMVPAEMLFYDKGVLNVQTCKCDPNQIDHVVVLTGYGNDGGLDYYMIRNSWSTYWGDQGYINIARGKLDCCISSDPGYPEIAPNEAIVV